MAKRQDAIPEITLGEQVPEVRPVPPVVRVTREIATVIIEVPICTNPPDSHKATHLNFHLIPSRSKTAKETVHRLWSALIETGATLANGYKVRDRNHAVLWLLEQIGEQPK